MNLSGLLALLREQSAYKDLLSGGLQKPGPVALNLVRASRPFVTAALAADVNAADG